MLFDQICTLKQAMESEAIFQVSSILATVKEVIPMVYLRFFDFFHLISNQNLIGYNIFSLLGVDAI